MERHTAWLSHDARCAVRAAERVGGGNDCASYYGGNNKAHTVDLGSQDLGAAGGQDVTQMLREYYKTESCDRPDDIGLWRRESLRFDPGVRKVLDRLWQVADINNSGDIDEEEYVSMYLSMWNFLTAGDSVESEVVDLAKIEFKSDCADGCTTLDRQRFIQCWFQLAATWVESDDTHSDAYVDFLTGILPTMMAHASKQASARAAAAAAAAAFAADLAATSAVASLTPQPAPCAHLALGPVQHSLEPGKHSSKQLVPRPPAARVVHEASNKPRVSPRNRGARVPANVTGMLATVAARRNSCNNFLRLQATSKAAKQARQKPAQTAPRNTATIHDFPGLPVALARRGPAPRTEARCLSFRA
jgi:hypothetical protein